MTNKRILFSVAAVATLILSGCGGGSTSGGEDTVTGQVIDHTVVGLPYTCSPSAMSGETDENGEYTCESNDATVVFKLGTKELPAVAVISNGIVTPYTIYPGQPEMALNLAQLLQSLDDNLSDGSIDLNAEELEKLFDEASDLDFTSETFDDDIAGLLKDANMTLVSEKDAQAHLDEYLPADEIAPVITLNGESEMRMNHGRTFTDLGATALDDRDGVVKVSVIGKVDTNIVGTYTLTYTATDAAGNKSTKTRTVTVVDEEAPEIMLNGKSIMKIDHGSTFTDPGASATDNSDGIVDVSVAGSVDTGKVGIYTLTYTATDASGNSASETRTVTVVDGKAPVIELIGESEMRIDQGSTFTDPGASATDNADGSVAVSVVGSVDTGTVGTYTLTYTATDASGNSARETRTVIVLDKETPVITLNGNASMNIALNDDFTDPGASATDNVDGTVAVSVMGSVDTGTVGTYTLTYTAKDAAGNKSTKTRTVKVEEVCENVNPITGECEDEEECENVNPITGECED